MEPHALALGRRMLHCSTHIPSLSLLKLQTVTDAAGQKEQVVPFPHPIFLTFLRIETSRTEFVLSRVSMQQPMLLVLL